MDQQTWRFWGLWFRRCNWGPVKFFFGTLVDEFDSLLNILWVSISSVKLSAIFWAILEDGFNEFPNIWGALELFSNLNGQYFKQLFTQQIDTQIMTVGSYSFLSVASVLEICLLFVELITLVSFFNGLDSDIWIELAGQSKTKFYYIEYIQKPCIFHNEPSLLQLYYRYIV